MVLAGVCFIIAAAAVLLAFLTSGKGGLAGGVSVVAWIVVVVALLVAAVANLRPPIALTLDEAGFHARGRHGDGTWKAVESVEVDRQMLRFTDGNGEVTAYPLNLVDRNQRTALIRDVYDRLNTANGYRRFDPAEWA